MPIKETKEILSMVMTLSLINTLYGLAPELSPREVTTIELNRTTLEGGNSTTLGGGNSTTLGGGNSTTLGGGNSTTLGGGNSTTLGGGNSTTLGGGNSTTLGGGNSTTLGGGHSTTLGGGNSTTLEGGNSTEEIVTAPYAELLLENRTALKLYIEDNLWQAMKAEKGTGCTMPKLDPFAPSMMQLVNAVEPLNCNGTDWVRCNQSFCGVRHDIPKFKYIRCEYRDILFITDHIDYMDEPVTRENFEIYELKKSDHALVKCRARLKEDNSYETWSSVVAGLRNIEQKPNGEHGYNIMIIGFDSTSRNNFIRRMTKSYKVLKKDLEAVIMEGYNIVGDGTQAALIPLLTGMTELEHPEIRTNSRDAHHRADDLPFIWYKLKNIGYKTAFFEDMAAVATFSYKLNGFKFMPTDYYLRHYMLKARKLFNQTYCFGDTPIHETMLDLTRQFMEHKGKKFIFTFISTIPHGDYNAISLIDDYFADWLIKTKERGTLNNTFFIVMGDHGTRFGEPREILQGKQEERLPMMAIMLPKQMLQAKPQALETLLKNSKVLTTPFDIHATLLDVAEIPQHKVKIKVKGADMPRSLSLFEPIPENRSCPEAGVQPHWCSCVSWLPLNTNHSLSQSAANALVKYINSLTVSERDLCEERSLISIEWAMRAQPNERMLKFLNSIDDDFYLGTFEAWTQIYHENLSIKIKVTPQNSIYEATMVYDKITSEFRVKSLDISRVDAYGSAPACIRQRRPDLLKYCHCKKR